jgi:glycine/D-amino acid oxidase-like deaminating enzyme
MDDPAPSVPAERLQRDERADVVIIGAGISAAFLAEELTRADLSVVMLDRRAPVTGATAASTALILHEIDTPLTHLSQKIGQAKAVAAWRRSRLGLESLVARAETLGIDCDLSRTSSLYLAGNTLDEEGLRAEAQARNRAGIACDYLTAAETADLCGVRRRAGILSPQCVTLHPVRLAAGLLLAAQARGLRIFAPCEAKAIHSGSEMHDVITDCGASVRAKHVIYATGYEIPEQVHSKRHRIFSTWVIATGPQPARAAALQNVMIWEAMDPYLYVRAMPDGRIICGGEDEKFSNEAARDALLPEKTRILQEKLQKLLPGVDARAEYAWAGAFGASTTGLPSIGRIPHKRNIYAIMAYGGNGISFSRIAAEVIGAAILGDRDPDSALFAFGR